MFKTKLIRYFIKNGSMKITSWQLCLYSFIYSLQKHGGNIDQILLDEFGINKVPQSFISIIK